MQYLPIFMDVKNKPVLVVGGGEVASRKVDLLLSAKAKVTVVSPQFSDMLTRYAEAGKIAQVIDGYDSKYLADSVMVWVTTDNGELNKQIWQECNERRILVNVADQQELCEFITPSIIDRSPLQIAISSGGRSPVLIRYLREKLEAVLPTSLGTIGEFAGEQREAVQDKFATVTERRRFWERFFSSDALEVAGDASELARNFESQLNTPVGDLSGDIYLIKPAAESDLLSLRSLRFMQQSDVIIYGDDVSMDLVELCRRDADRLPSEKAAHQQDALSRCKQGDRVCILTADQALYDSLLIEVEGIIAIA